MFNLNEHGKAVKAVFGTVDEKCFWKILIYFYFFCFKLICFWYFQIILMCWYQKLFLKNKNIILMYFGIKKNLKNNHYHTPKYSLRAFIEVETRFEIYIKK